MVLVLKVYKKKEAVEDVEKKRGEEKQIRNRAMSKWLPQNT